MAEPNERESRRGAADTIGEGIRSGLGILSAFKDAMEETLQEAIERGDLSPDRARQAVRDSMNRFQEGMDEARERFDFVSRKEHESLQSQLTALRARVEALERREFDQGDSGIIIEAE
jgi:polyhydroxyalkanoate synthesis regulator phasin